jgi:UDP-N-acetylglucosamine 2-epimerase (non-hydrolysing)
VKVIFYAIMTPKLVFIYGTRPEAIKIGPVVRELRNIGIEPSLIATGQHQSLLSGTPAESDLGNSVSLNLSSNGEVSEWVSRAVPRIVKHLETFHAGSTVIVQGDTMSAYAGALAASQMRLPLVHIEAGLRSGDLEEPWPEERIRKAISLRALWHYAPTKRAMMHLVREGIPETRIKLTGNPIVSAIHCYADPKPQEIPENQVLVTMHRREWTDLGRACVLETIFALLESAEAYPDVRFLWPMHPGVAKIAEIDLSKPPQNVRIGPPLPYREAIGTLKASLGVATDSGGLTEEAAVLGVPCAVLRNVSDRQESLDEGVAKLFFPGPEGIREAVKCLVGRELPRKPSLAYGTPASALNIATELSVL